MRRRLSLLIVPALLGAAVVGAAASAPDSKPQRCKADSQSTAAAARDGCLAVRLSDRGR